MAKRMKAKRGRAPGRLATRIDPGASGLSTFPSAQRRSLRTLAASLTRQSKGSRLRSPRAPQARRVVLFTGPDRAAKVAAAAALARETGREVYRIDLGRVVSKYIGETEKNLSRLFDAAAERERAVLFFDEADALLGKRSEVKDAHDRYANVETGYLLGRIDAYAGVVILATNRREAIDAPFLRRFQLTIEFPGSDATPKA